MGAAALLPRLGGRGAAAAASATSGRGESAFDAPEYGVSEESRTPNAHSRQEEGLKKAVRDSACAPERARGRDGRRFL